MVLEDDTKVTSSYISITPLDIHNKEFSRAVRGYAISEVDTFLDQIVSEFERLIRENEELNMTITDLESRLEHYKGLEETLKNAILLAQKAADEIRESADRESKAIIHEAEIKTERMRQHASQLLAEVYDELETNKQRLLKFKTEMKAFLNSNKELVEENIDKLVSNLEKYIEAGKKIWG